jgi:transcriptional regulator with PAS, ATPase and Fis domain
MSTTRKNIRGEEAKPAAPAARQACFLGVPAIVSGARMQSMLRLVERIARSDAAVLITGESGTGKELIARAVHAFSPRSGKQWIDLNCAALPDHLMESELFGYERGAFSGADTAKQGMFELAHQGTLFLDEIGELTSRNQSKLLRVLDGFPYYRLGGTRKIEVDVRVVAATNMDLEAEVRSGKFRADLFHRLNQMRIAVPPLRERPDEVGPLATLFLAQVDPQLAITDEAIAALECYSWPGNIRELKNLIARLAVMNNNGREIGVDDLPLEYQVPRSEAETPSAGYSLDKLEQSVILHALEQAEGRRSRAAELLGISRRTLIRRLKTYGVNGRNSFECGDMECN